MEAVAAMDKEAIEILAYFRDDVSELKVLGKDWGLSDLEIAQCIENAVSMKAEDLPPSTKTIHKRIAAQKSWRKVRCLLKILPVLLVVFTLFGVGSTLLENEVVDHFMSKSFSNLVWPVTRVIRFAAVPFHGIINFYDVFLEECVVLNPLLNKDRSTGNFLCEVCAGVDKVVELMKPNENLTDSDAQIFDSSFLSPIFVRSAGANVTFEALQGILRACPNVLKTVSGVSTNLDWVSQVKDLLSDDAKEKLTAQQDFYFFWVSKLVSTSQILRKLFPKPSFLNSSEVHYRKHLYIFGPNAKEFELSTNQAAQFFWYAQGQGSTEVELVPVNKCQKECRTFRVLLLPGDMLTYPGEVYIVRAKPAQDHGIGISFFGLFEPFSLR